jgi:hypothetical protein
MINIEKLLENLLNKDTIHNNTVNNNDTCINSTVIDRAVIKDTVITDTFIKDTVITDTVITDTVITDTVITDTEKSDTLNKDTIKNDTDNHFYKEVKVETFLHLNINKDFIKECLNMSNVNGDIKLFKKIYIDNILKEYYPIRHIKKKLQYWLNNHMNDDDTNGTYIKNIIFKNMETCYLKINIFDEYADNTEQFLKNQEHINKLSEQKYKDKFLTKIIQIITI